MKIAVKSYEKELEILAIKEKENRIKTKTLGLIIFLACTILAVSSGKLIAQDQISVRLEANASADCFPASALHLEDLRIVLSKSCPECSYENEENEIDAFRFVVEDPFLGWSVTVYDKDGNSIGQIHWWQNHGINANSRVDTNAIALIGPLILKNLGIDICEYFQHRFNTIGRSP